MGIFTEVNQLIHSDFYRANKYKVQFADLQRYSRDVGNTLNNYSSLIKNIQLPDFTTSPIESYASNTWHIASGKEDIYQIQMVLYNTKTINKESVDIYKKILTQWKKQKISYPNDISFTLKVIPKNKKNQSNISIIFRECLISAISGLTLDSSIQGDVGEFSITIKSPGVYLEDVRDYMYGV